MLRPATETQRAGGRGASRYFEHDGARKHVVQGAALFVEEHRRGADAERQHAQRPDDCSQERACCGQRLTVAVGHFNADGDHADALAAPGPQREEKKRHKGDIGEQDDVDPLLLGAGEFGVGTEGGGEESPGRRGAAQGDPSEEAQRRKRAGEAEQHTRWVIDVAVAGGELLETFAAQGADYALNLALAKGETKVPDAQAAQQLAADFALPGALVRPETGSRAVVVLESAEDSG